MNWIENEMEEQKHIIKQRQQNDEHSTQAHIENERNNNYAFDRNKSELICT